MILPEYFITQISSAIEKNVAPDVTVERVGKTGLAVRMPSGAGSIEGLAFRVPEESWIPFLFPTKLTARHIAERYKVAVECVSGLSTEVNPTWKGSLVPPFTTHVAVDGTRVKLRLKDSQGSQLEFDVVETAT